METKIQKTITIYESQKIPIQKYADSLHKNDFSRAVRVILRKWIKEHEETNDNK